MERPLGPLADVRSGRFGLVKKALIVLGALALIALVVGHIDFDRDMHRLNAGMLSGVTDGGYAAIVRDLAARAAIHRGKLRDLSSNGSAENVARLVAAKDSCEAAFALVQDGSDFGRPSKLELIGRLPKSESVFFLARDGDKRSSLASLARARIGVGLDGSGSAQLARQIFALDDLGSLGVELRYGAPAQQIVEAERGDLEVVMLVIDEDAKLLVDTMRRGQLQIAALSNLDVVARRIPRLRTGRIGAGQFDALRGIPAEDKRVLRLDTLVVTNGCAGRSATIDLLTVLADRFPDFVRHNKDTPNATGLELASVSHGFFEHGGPELADEFLPWLVDLMPPANWAYVIMGISILFNTMGAAHRFRLWRIDDARVKLETELSRLFGAGATLGDIQRTRPSGKLAEEEARNKIDDLIGRFEALATRSRRQSLSMLVPMGQEMGYRYQEGVIHQTLAVLRAFRERLRGTP
jgi:hypothetical protein